jgi:hypothetical protein
MLPMFKALLLKKYLLTTPKEMDSVVCAVAGLQQIPGEKTMKILEEALRLKRSEYRGVISQAIQLLSRSAAAQPSRSKEV